jgi:hypothetical protein
MSVLTGKTITELPNLASPTLNASIPIQESGTTYNVSVNDLADTISNADPFLNVSANYYSNPNVYSESIYISAGTNALIIGPVVTFVSGATLTVDGDLIIL